MSTSKESVGQKKEKNLAEERGDGKRKRRKKDRKNASESRENESGTLCEGQIDGKNDEVEEKPGKGEKPEMIRK